MDTIFRDVRFALRQLLRQPVFSLIVIVTIAVAIGGNVAIFSVFEGVVMRPLPWPEADRLVAIWESQDRSRSRQPFTGPDYLEVAGEAGSFSSAGAVETRWVNLSGGQEPIRISCGFCTASILELLGVEPLHGRLFTGTGEVPGNDRVVVLSHALWQSHFGCDPQIAGSPVTLDGETWEVVGVMPASFRFPAPWGGRDTTGLWAPLTADRIGTDRSAHWLAVYGRLAPGVTVEQAEAELDLIAGRLAGAWPGTNTDTRMWTEPIMARSVGRVRSLITFLLGIVGLVFLMACANTAGMLLSRGLNRTGEFALRAALGAGRRGLIGQLMVESLVVAAIGGAAGIVLSFWGVDLLRTLLPADFPRADLLAVNLTALGFAALIVCTTGLLIGLAPALFASRTALAATVRRAWSRPTDSRNRMLTLLTSGQIAIAFILVNAALVLVASYARVMNQSFNFNLDDVVVTEIILSGEAYDTPVERRVFHDELIRRVRTRPEVLQAGIASKLPLRGGSNSWVLIGARRAETTERGPLVEHKFIGDGFLETMGIDLLAGRTFDERDMALAAGHAGRSDSGVELPVIVSRALVERMIPGGDPLGLTIRPREHDEDYWQGRIIGVVEDVRQWGPEVSALPELYLPQTAEPWGPFWTRVAVRTGGDPARVAPVLREVLGAIDPALPLAAPVTMEQILADSTAERRFSLLLIGLCAGVALLLTITGTCGVISYSVSRRLHEIGVRMALGADRRRVARFFASRAGRLLVAGLVIGLGATLALAHVLGSMVFGIRAVHPLVLAVTAVMMSAAALAATALPLLRAIRVDPLEILRSE